MYVSAGGSDMDRWRWSRPDVEVYTMLVNGLAASLRVSDSLRIITDICRVGISPAEEVSKQASNSLLRCKKLVFDWHCCC